MAKNNLMAKARRAWRARGGTAAVEFAMVLPLLALMLFGTIDIGRLLMDYQLVSKTMRDATRLLARSGFDDIGLTCTGVDATKQKVIDAKNLALKGTITATDANLLGYWTDPTTILITARCITNDNGGVEIFQGFYAGKPQIYSVTMSANIAFPLMNGWLLDRGAGLSFNIGHEEIHIGQ